MTFAMYERLAEITESPGDARVLIITGTGDKAFAAGTDINQFRTFSCADDALICEARIDATRSSFSGGPCR
jgi:enoyl-CoA hydratase